MSVQRIIPLDAAPAREAQVSPTPASVFISGNGETKAWPALMTSDGVVNSGVWESDAFSKKKAHPDSMEFCYIIEGTVELSDTAGNVATFGAGEAFIVEPGFDGVWTSLTKVRKYFVIAKCQPAITVDVADVTKSSAQESHEQVL